MTTRETSSAPPVNRTDVWCALPVYNNASTIRGVVERTLGQTRQVIVVDDGSTDADLRNLLSGLDIVLLQHPRNLGKGAAILTALRYAQSQNATYLITLDGDGQHFPEDLPQFFAQLAPHTILIGHRHEVVGVMPRSSSFGRDFSDLWVRIATGACASDTQSGFRAYPVPETLALGLVSQHYNFEVEVITRGIWAGLLLQKVMIRVWYPPAEQRVSSFRPVIDNLRLSLLHARLVVRQLLPLPHHRLVRSRVADAGPRSCLPFLPSHATPLGLAATACVAVSLGALPALWCRALAILYFSARLHLDWMTSLIILGLCAYPLLPSVCLALGRRLLHGADAGTAPGLWEWFVGSLIVAPLSGAIAAFITYRIARWVGKPSDIHCMPKATDRTRPTPEAASEHR